MSKNDKVILCVDRDGATGRFQLSLKKGDDGCRLKGPKYIGRSYSIAHWKIDEIDKKHIKEQLDEFFGENNDDNTPEHDWEVKLMKCPECKKQMKMAVDKESDHRKTFCRQCNQSVLWETVA